MARTSITIVLELDPAADIPVGSARLPGETPRRFHGWLGLAEAIDSLTGMSARDDATSTVSAHALPAMTWPLARGAASTAEEG